MNELLSASYINEKLCKEQTMNPFQNENSSLYNMHTNRSLQGLYILNFANHRKVVDEFSIFPNPNQTNPNENVEVVKEPGKMSTSRL